MKRSSLVLGAAGTAAIALSLLGVAGFSHSGLASAAMAARIKLPAAVRAPAARPEFSATFSGKLNTKTWDRCYPYASQSGCTNFGNTEYEWFLPSQVKVSGGALRLVAQRENTVGKTKTGARKVYGCRSGMVTSYPGFRKFKYGFIQVVADIPHKPGLWSGLWLIPANGQFPPEMDMLESWGVNVNQASFFHPIRPISGKKTLRGQIPLSLTEGWQTYSLRWTKSSLTYYVGNRVVLTVTKDVPKIAMYFIADLAEYQKPTSKADCTGQLLIKAVKIWKQT
jgi:beta-glucanase (GH16 family)